MIKVILYLCLILLVACKGSSSSNSSSKWEEIGLEKYGSSASVTISPDHKYVLMHNEFGKTSTGYENKLEFSVVNINSEVKVYESSVTLGSVGWYDTHRLEIFRTPGTIPPSKSKNDFIEIYNVETKESVKKSDLVGPSTD